MEEHKSEDDLKKLVEECEDPECRDHAVIRISQNQRTTSSGDRRSEECRSGDGHLELPPRIIEFIHLRNVFQKEVITFSRLWEEKKLISEDQALIFQRRLLNQ